MLNIFGRLVAVICLIIAVLAVIGYLLPKGYEVEATAQIAAPAAEVFPMINQVPNWKHWSPWNPDKIEGLTITYSDQKSGVGASQKWTDARGDGEMRITAIEPNRRVDYESEFMGFPKMVSYIELTEIDGKTNVVWRSTGQLPSTPFYGYTRFLFGPQMQYQYENSLKDLEAIVRD